MQETKINQQLNIDSIPITSVPDKETKAMVADMATAQKDEKSARDNIITQCYNEFFQGMKDNRYLRKIFGIWICGGLAVYMLCVFITLWCSNHLNLTQNTYISLLTTTTINLIGLVGIVFKFLFSDHDKDFLIAHKFSHYK